MKKQTYPPSERELELIEVVKQFLLTNLNENFPIDHIAKQCKVSRYFLKKRFKQICNLTVKSYIKQQRLNIAAEKLMQGVSVKQVAAEANFNYVTGFEKAFKKQFNQTPEKYIKT